MIVNILEDGIFQRRDYSVFTPAFPFGEIMAIESKDYKTDLSGSTSAVMVIDCGNGVSIATTGFTAIGPAPEEIRITSHRAVRRILEVMDFGVDFGPDGEDIKCIYACHAEWDPVWMLIAEFDPKPPRNRWEELFKNSDGWACAEVKSISFALPEKLSTFCEIF